MRKYLLLILLFFLTLPTFGQWRSDDYIESCRQIETSLDTGELCQGFFVCIYDTVQDNCFEQLVLSLLEQCYATELRACEERVILYASAMDELNYNYAEQTVLYKVVAYYDVGNYAGAIGTLQAIMREQSYFPMSTHYLALGILYNQLEDYELAIESFSESIAINFYNPWVFYFRAKAYQALNEEELAARDYYTYDALASDEIKLAFPQPELSYEPPEMANWIAYPIRMSSNGPGGSSTRDLSLEPAFNTQLVQLDGGATLAITSLTSESLDLMFLTQNPDDSSQYSLSKETQGIPGMLGGGETMFSVTISSDYILYRIFAYGAESGSVTEGVLLPQDSIDPRPDMENRVCEGLPLSYIHIGDEVWSGSDFSVLDMGHSEPDIDSEEVFIDNDIVLVEDGPICTDEFIWWHVSYDGEMAWIPENYTNNYVAVPWGVSQPSVEELLGLSDGLSP